MWQQAKHSLEVRLTLSAYFESCTFGDEMSVTLASMLTGKGIHLFQKKKSYYCVKVKLVDLIVDACDILPKCL